MLDYLNPFSDNFILKDVFSFFGTLLDYLNPFSENFIFKQIFTFIGNFFSDMWDFFYHFFVPTDEQWKELEGDYASIGDTIKNHIPFVGLLSEELKKAQDTVEKTDFLIITVPSFSYQGSGGIGVSTDEQKVINVGQAYEPYRAYIRGFLFLIVVGLAVVYLIRYILNYGSIGSVGSINSGNGKGGDN